MGFSFLCGKLDLWGERPPHGISRKKDFFTQVEKTFKLTSSIHNARNPWESFSHMSRKLPNSTPPYTVPVTHENRRFILGDKRSRSDLTVLWTCGQARQVFLCENQSSSPGRQASPTPAQPLSAFFCVWKTMLQLTYIPITGEWNSVEDLATCESRVLFGSHKSS